MNRCRIENKYASYDQRNGQVHNYDLKETLDRDHHRRVALPSLRHIRLAGTRTG